MTANMQPVSCDVTVVGAGLAGVATALHLARRGLSVICVGPGRSYAAVGESLDFGALPLLEDLGFTDEDLACGRLATPKHGITVHAPDCSCFSLRPYQWLRFWPLCFRYETVHINRGAFDRWLYQLAAAKGVTFIDERVARCETADDHVTEVVTRSGVQLRSTWYIDATGQSRVLARSCGAKAHASGCARVALWAHVLDARLPEGCTVLNFGSPAKYLTWCWQIPISRELTSIGVVMDAETVASERRRGLNIEQIWRGELGRLGLHPALECPSKVLSCAFRPGQLDRMCGRNWMAVGDSAALIDPVTSHGITAALRFGRAAAELINGSPERILSDRKQLRFHRTYSLVARSYNARVESLLYSPRFRQRYGSRGAIIRYVIFGFFASWIYGRVPVWTALGAMASRNAICAMSMLTSFLSAPARRARPAKHEGSPICTSS